MMRVLGLGNALVDILAKLESDELLNQLNLPKGSMQLVDKDKVAEVISATSSLQKVQASGGSVANAIHGLAKLGAKTGFIGKVGNDSFGQFFEADMSANNITPQLLKMDGETGQAYALISPDSERTFATFLGAAVNLSADNLTPAMFEGYNILHIEGYLVFNQDLVKRACEIADKLDMIISIDLASYNVVEANLDFLKKIVDEYVDIVFANEEEAKAFTGLEAEQALEKIAEHCDIAVVKIGEKGSLIMQFEDKFEVGVFPAKPVDTTGAGDLYAAGFLYGYCNLLDLEICGKLGALLSANVIEFIGPKMDEERWSKIRSEVVKIIE